MSNRRNVAVVGPSAFVTVFQLVGVEGFDAETPDSVITTLQALIDEKRFKLIILPERFTQETKTLRINTQKKALSPIFILIPDFTRETGSRMDELQAIISSAIGTKMDI